MKIGIISDTHDNIDNILKSVREFNNRQVDLVLHAGDFVSPIAVESFAGIKLVGILGNNDTDIRGLTSAFDKIHDPTSPVSAYGFKIGGIVHHIKYCFLV